jgi:hypothetical protein
VLKLINLFVFVLNLINSVVAKKPSKAGVFLGVLFQMEHSALSTTDQGLPGSVPELILRYGHIRGISASIGA